MIADCDEDNRCLLKSILELKGFNVLEAADGQEAFDIAIERLPDLVLIDLKLPVVSGFTVIRRIRKLAGLTRDTNHRHLIQPANLAPRAGPGGRMRRAHGKTN